MLENSQKKSIKNLKNEKTFFWLHFQQKRIRTGQKRKKENFIFDPFLPKPGQRIAKKIEKKF